jgi:hypothetical protein
MRPGLLRGSQPKFAVLNFKMYGRKYSFIPHSLPDNNFACIIIKHKLDQ